MAFIDQESRQDFEMPLKIELDQTSHFYKILSFHLLFYIRWVQKLFEILLQILQTLVLILLPLIHIALHQSNFLVNIEVRNLDACSFDFQEHGISFESLKDFGDCLLISLYLVHLNYRDFHEADIKLKSLQLQSFTMDCKVNFDRVSFMENEGVGIHLFYWLKTVVLQNHYS